MKIMKLPVCLVFLIFLHLDLSGQAEAGLRVSSGASYVRSGDQLYDRHGSSDPLFSWSIGVNIQKNLTSKMAGILELQTARKGYSFQIRNYFDLNSIEAKRTKLSITLNALSVYQWTLGTGKKKVQSFGLQYGCFLTRNTLQRWKYGEQKPVNVDGSDKPWDTGFIVGAGYRNHLSKKKFLVIDFRYNQGLFDISTSPERTKSRSLEVGVCYAFAIKK